MVTSAEVMREHVVMEGKKVSKKTRSAETAEEEPGLGTDCTFCSRKLTATDDTNTGDAAVPPPEPHCPSCGKHAIPDDKPTDEGEAELEEEVIDGFAIISFLNLRDLQVSNPTHASLCVMSFYTK